jgi:pyruvate dehydrogenase E1 component alpha subunit
MSLEEPHEDDDDIALRRVLREDGTADPAFDPGLPRETLLRAYREMRRLRLLDARMTALQRQGRIGFHGSAQGQEAVPIAAGLVLAPDDWVFPALREESVMLVRGFPLATLVAQSFGNTADVLKGRQMPSHASGRAVNQVSWSSCIATQLPHAVGAAWAMRAQKSNAVALAFLGDGATSHPDFHAAMNFAGVWKVPCVFVCQNNFFSISLPFPRQTASATIAVKGRAYGVPGVRVDGNDVLAVVAVLERAVAQARAGRGPTLVEAVTYRMGPHSTSDDPSRYRSAAEVESWAARDPVARLRKHLEGLGLASEEADAALEAELGAEISAAIAAVESLPAWPSSSLFEDVYAEMPWHLREQLGENGRPL